MHAGIDLMMSFLRSLTDDIRIKNVTTLLRTVSHYLKNNFDKEQETKI